MSEPSRYEAGAIVAAIEADYDNMKHSDLVLTCRMLVRALALKLDSMPSGLSAGQSIKLEQELATLRADNARLQGLAGDADKLNLEYHAKIKQLETDNARKDAEIARLKCGPHQHSGDCHWWSYRVCDCGYLMRANSHDFGEPSEQVIADFAEHSQNCQSAKSKTLVQWPAF